MSKSAMIVREASCRCGRVRCRAAGKPIVSVVCYCEDCQEGGRILEALPDAPRFRDADGGTPLLVYRDDRFECLSGEELLAPFPAQAGFADPEDGGDVLQLRDLPQVRAWLLGVGVQSPVRRRRSAADRDARSDRAPPRGHGSSDRRAVLSGFSPSTVRQGHLFASRHAARPVERPKRALERYPIEPNRHHCEERSDEAIQGRSPAALDCFASLAMTRRAIPFARIPL